MPRRNQAAMEDQFSGEMSIHPVYPLKESEAMEHIDAENQTQDLQTALEDTDDRNIFNHKDSSVHKNQTQDLQTALEDTDDGDVFNHKDSSVHMNTIEELVKEETPVGNSYADIDAEFTGLSNSKHEASGKLTGNCIKS
ncbi:hypothetical protein DICVIV_11545 [Dictyocaulus viviparus]|uniref:Uncharacterized protein n=1 Tax=Dictyocaulus viviparus TaxID=29172 RepID=A0A0D8XCY1_DICVI|nr:hypothetical protein DICVIV_11545 [Dictyocaulus viviparus]